VLLIRASVPPTLVRVMVERHATQALSWAQRIADTLKV
jgi:hypothetical protein